ncbi:hypothetical protein Q644_20845 [Brucella intermedia 229E]|uniref:NAD(P)-binding domain-containing protein n=1 Tax=Brucella intermedia 229E TaxID=1337887 RepID=U4V6H4_9HYPH|nr:hypothetical protein Q644_20845 [Brucella intermedia 229E]
MGANRNSPFFYSRVKGELEADLAMLDFPSLTLVRPGGLIGGDRAERRAGEHVATLAKTFRPRPPQGLADQSRYKDRGGSARSRAWSSHRNEDHRFGGDVLILRNGSGSSNM